MWRQGRTRPLYGNQLALEACGPYKGNFIEGKAKGNIDPVDAKRELEDHLDGNGPLIPGKVGYGSRTWILSEFGSGSDAWIPKGFGFGSNYPWARPILCDHIGFDRVSLSSPYARERWTYIKLHTLQLFRGPASSLELMELCPWNFKSYPLFKVSKLFLSASF